MIRQWKDSEIANWANGVRRYLGTQLNERIDVFELMHKLSSETDAKLKVSFHIVPPLRLPNSLAEAEPANRLIRYRQTLHTAILKGEPFAGEVMLEEIGHVLLHGHRKVLNHFNGRDFRAANIPDVEREEREAKKFSWYTLAPISEAYTVRDWKMLVERFALSPEMAEQYFEHILRMRNQMERSSRNLPPGVADLLQYRKNRGTIAVGANATSNPVPTNSDKDAQPSSSPRIVGTSNTVFIERPPVSSHLLCPECGHDMKMNGVGCAVCQTCGHQDGCD